MEKLGHFGMLVGHVPPGEDDCMYQWAIRLRALQDRYQNVIRFSIHGHSHLENYNLVRSFPSTGPENYFNRFDLIKGIEANQ